ncbi:hypothetical protein LH392_06740 [Corynebacterium uberis]|uniref:hypothetical protein n=1 Tax=Corynebacterium uberis TaxID=2883169 RepID=UPI001D0AC46A|nr:hypothetical protein [Corynebacterium uberis]UDL77042.1 hypothetical protein LH393_06335 [Corynebacterium uberis]UDL79253.1 hypothetical protein LH394_06325 [Corynebacterium uberis]UDL81458.1 hypothetical protein LH392_06740 [Corynebacterium uberis]UDL83670.1 hypothetical protein LH395_06335 [Corynebacterium uberis]UDL85881.1 hypothetical protein LH390_06330 [Corynebacterium uberis]
MTLPEAHPADTHPADTHSGTTPVVLEATGVRTTRPTRPARPARSAQSTPAPEVTFTASPGLTVLRGGREDHTTALSLTLAGRRRPSAGTITLHDRHKSWSRAGELFSRIALAGATEIDSLERQVPVRAVVKEQLAWSVPWWKPVGDPADHPHVRDWAGLLGIADTIAAREPVGGLAVADRFRLRILLSLIARPRARLLVIDDIDQVRDMGLRAELLADAALLSTRIPVIVSTVNELAGQVAPGVAAACTLIDVRGGAARRAADAAAVPARGEGVR